MRLRTLGAAALVALALLVATRQIAPSGAYARHGAYRAQVEALLDGRLALSRAPEGLAHDLAWTPSGTQQVWGLGVPLWQLPFEVAGRAVGLSPFPDRIALAVFLALAIFLLLRAFGERGRRAELVGAVLLTVLLPGFVAMLRGRVGVYEEAAAYAYAAGIGLLGGAVLLARRPSGWRYVALVAAAGLTGLLRPTVWFYGLGTAVIATVVYARAVPLRTAAPRIALAAALFVAGGGALYATNAARFGAGTEFGHRLNLESLPGNIVATRFDSPLAHAGWLEGAGELAGALFDRPERAWKRGFYQTHLAALESPRPRWREYYFTTFAWPYVPLLAAGLVLAALAWRRRGDPIARALGAWAVLGGAPLAAFYVHAPSLSSRYLLDLAPAFAALLLVAWRAAVRARPRVALAALVALWCAAVVTSKVTRPPGASEPVGRSEAALAAAALARPLAYDRALPGEYDLDAPPVWNDVLAQFDRCRDETGAPIDCAAEALPGDVRVHGDRDGARWWVRTETVVDDAALACALDAPVCAPDAPATRLDGTASPAPALYLNGTGWDLATGAVPPATYFFVDDARALELDVAGPPDTDWPHAVQAILGRDRMMLESVASLPRGARLRFTAPLHPGLSVAFLAFGPTDQLDRPRSALSLLRVATDSRPASGN